MFARTYLQRVLAGVGIALVCYVHVGLFGCVSAELPSRSEAPQVVADEVEERGRFQLFSRERDADRTVENREQPEDSGMRETIENIAHTVTQYTAPSGAFWTAAREQISAPTYQQLIMLTAGVCIAALCAVVASSVLG